MYSIIHVLKFRIETSTKKSQIKSFKHLIENTIEEKKSLYLVSTLYELDKTLFENKDFDHLKTFLWFWSDKDPDVQTDFDSDTETQLGTKFIRWAGERKTIVVERKLFLDALTDFFNRIDKVFQKID